MTACTRSRRPSFCRMRATCVFAVASLITSRCADLRVRQSASEQVEHLALARRQVARARAGRWRRGPGCRANSSIDGARDGGRQQRVAARDDPNGGGDLLRRRVLEHEPARAGAQRVVDVAVEAERGQDQHPRRRVARGRSDGSPRCRRAPACGCPSARRRAQPAGLRTTASSPSRGLADDVTCPARSRGSCAARRARAPGRRRSGRVVIGSAAARGRRSRRSGAAGRRTRRRRGRPARACRPGRGRRSTTGVARSPGRRR